RRRSISSSHPPRRYCWLTQIGGLEGFALQEEIVFTGRLGGKAAQTTRKKETSRGPAAPHPAGELASNIIGAGVLCIADQLYAIRHTYYGEVSYGLSPSARGLDSAPGGARRVSFHPALVLWIPGLHGGAHARLAGAELYQVELAAAAELDRHRQLCAHGRR